MVTIIERKDGGGLSIKDLSELDSQTPEIFCIFGGDGLMGLTSCPESVLVLGFDSRGDKTLLHAF